MATGHAVVHTAREAWFLEQNSGDFNQMKIYYSKSEFDGPCEKLLIIMEDLRGKVTRID